MEDDNADREEETKTINLILQSYDEVFKQKEGSMGDNKKMSWVDECEDRSNNEEEIAYVSATQTYEESE